jgi:hypothetical protein
MPIGFGAVKATSFTDRNKIEDLFDSKKKAVPCKATLHYVS